MKEPSGEAEGTVAETTKEGVFGKIYTQFRGKVKEAIDYLKKKKGGEAVAALHHHAIGDISLVWGNKKARLEKILRKHPEVADNLQEIIDNMEVVSEPDNRIKLESPTHFAVVSKEYQGTPREKWLLTAFEKRETSTLTNSSMDVESNLDGKSDDTATRLNVDVSGGKGTNNSGNDQINQQKNDENQPKTGEKSVQNDSNAGRASMLAYEAWKAASVKEPSGKAEGTGAVRSNETNEYGKPFIVSKDGSTIFGEITEEDGLTPAPIKLSEGENYVGEDGKNHGYGLLHIEAGHGDQIRKAGFASVEEFVEEVARNFDTIREGNMIADKQTYLLEVSDKHNNTLFIELSKDGTYWNVNSAGIFKTKYSKNKKKVNSLPTVGDSTSTDAIGVNHGQEEGATVTSENSPLTSEGKVTNNSGNDQINQRKNAENQPKTGEKITKIDSPISGSTTSDALGNSTFVTGAKLLKDVEKSKKKDEKSW